jgi:hypothetical protein
LPLRPGRPAAYGFGCLAVWPDRIAVSAWPSCRSGFAALPPMVLTVLPYGLAVLRYGLAVAAYDFDCLAVWPGRLAVTVWPS